MKVSNVLKVVLWLAMAAGLAVMIAIPVTMSHTPEQLPGILSLDTPVTLTFFANAYRVYPKGLAILYVMGLLGLWICAELLVMLNTMKSDPFVSRNAKALMRIGWVAMVVASLAFWAGYRWRDSLMSLGACTMLILGLFAMTLSQLFRKAIQYKEENDLTI